MKVIEKYLTMSKEEQIKDYKNLIYTSGGVLSIEEVFDYLNSEVKKDPLEKLGFEKINSEKWQRGKGIIKIEKSGKIDFYYHDSKQRRPSEKNELKAILEIIEGEKGGAE